MSHVATTYPPIAFHNPIFNTPVTYATLASYASVAAIGALTGAVAHRFRVGIEKKGIGAVIGAVSNLAIVFFLEMAKTYPIAIVVVGGIIGVSVIKGRNWILPKNEETLNHLNNWGRVFFLSGIATAALATLGSLASDAYFQ